MNILFLTIAYPENGANNLYTDLMDEFVRLGHNVSVVCQSERRFGQKTNLEVQNGINVLRVKSGNITKTNFIEKTISTLMIEFQYIRAINKLIMDYTVDLLVYSTPPITFLRVIENIKKKHNCFTYLILKDIFPQNAVDLEIINGKGLIWRYFRNKERRLYEISDKIGCMSEANVAYILKNNNLNAEKVEICRNSINPKEINIDIKKKSKLRADYKIPESATIFIYGGNLGAPQGIDFLINSFDSFAKIRDAFLLIIGAGTRYIDIRKKVEKSEYRNIRILPYMHKGAFEEMLALSDIGLIFLDYRFTIPNFPSRLNSYFEYSLPVLAVTDEVSDVKEFLIANNCGYWCRSNNLHDYISLVSKIIRDKGKFIDLGNNGRNLLISKFHVKDSCKTIIGSYNQYSGKE